MGKEEAKSVHGPWFSQDVEPMLLCWSHLWLVDKKIPLHTHVCLPIPCLPRGEPREAQQLFHVAGKTSFVEGSSWCPKPQAFQKLYPVTTFFALTQTGYFQEAQMIGLPHAYLVGREETPWGL